MILMPYVIMSMPDGDNKDFMEDLYRKYHRLMFSQAWKFFQDPHTVEDIVSISCIALLRNIDTLRHLGQSELKVYIVHAVSTAAINEYNKQQRANGLFIDTSDDVFDTATDGFNLEEKIVLEDELNRVLQAFRSLPEKEQHIMRMKYSLEMNDSEIATAVGLSTNSIRKYISRARKHLIDILYLE